MAENVVELQFKIAESAAISALKKLGNEAKTFEGKATASFSAVTRTFDVLKGVLLANVVTKGFQALSGAVASSVDDFKAFTGAIAEVNSILPANSKLTDETKQKFIEFSSAFGGKPQEQAKAFYQIVSAGITNVAQATEVLRVSNQAAVAGLSDMTTAADAITSVMATYGRAGVTAADASDTLFVAVREGKTTFSELGANIGKVAPIASSAGVKFSELAGTLAFLTKVGLSTDESSTGLRATITSLLKPSVESEMMFKKMGIAYGEAGLKANGLSGILDQVKEKTGGNVDAITKLFPNVRALGTVLAVTKGNFDDYGRILQETTNRQGATAAALDVVTNSVEFQQKKLVNSLSNIPTAFLMYFEQPILSALKAANDFMGGLKLIASYLDEVKKYYIVNEEAIKSYALAFGIITGTVLTAITAYKAYQAALVIAATVQLGFNAVLAANPIGLAVAGIALLTAGVGYLINHYKTIIPQLKQFGMAVLEFMITPIEMAASSLATVIGIFDNDMAASITATMEKFAEYRDDLTESFELEQEQAEAKKLKDEEEKLGIVAKMELKAKDRQADVDGEAKKQADLAKIKAMTEKAISKNDKEKAKKKLETDKANSDMELALVQEKTRVLTLDKEKNLAFTKYAENKNFQYIRENLGKKHAAELAYQVEILKSEGKFAEARQLINDTYSKAHAKDLDQKFKEEDRYQQRLEKHKYAGGKAVMAMEDFFANEQVRSTMGVNNQLLALQNSKNRKLAAIGKAAALIRIAQETAQGAISAYSSLAGIPIVGPVLGAIAAGALIAYGAERAHEVASSFEQGGIVPGTKYTGDNVRVGINSGEMILNKSQQAELFNIAKYGREDNNNNQDQGFISSLLNQPIVLEIDGTEIARAVRNAQNSGFILAGA